MTADPYRDSALRALADRWTETEAKAALWERCAADPHGDHQGRCEGCGQRQPLDPSHRVRASQGGRWNPANLLGICRRCHNELHDRPLWAKGLGWELYPGDDPTAEAVWMNHAVLGPGRYLLRNELDADGIRRHLVIPVKAVWVA